VPVYLDLATRLDEQSAERAAKAVTDKFVEAAKDINGVFGGMLGKVFEGLDGSGARNELKSVQDEYAKTARAAADASRMQVSSAGNVEVAVKRLHDAHDKYGASAAQTAAAENRVVDAWTRSGQAALDAAAAADVAAQAHHRVEEASTKAGGAAEGMNASMLLARAGPLALALAVAEATKKLYDMGEQWADVSDKITFTTGKIGADAATMTDQIAKIADRTAAPIQSIGNVYTQLTRLKDLSGSTLNDLTKQVADYDQMAQKSGADPLNLGVFTRTMQEFHVPASQVATDLNTMVSAAQDGQVPINELAQTMQTFGPTADLLGLSFAQTSNLLAVLDETGADVDKTLQSFRMGLTALAKDAPALQKQIKFGPDENDLQRMKDVIRRIQELYAENTAAASDAADKLGATVFSRQWQTIADDIKKGKVNLDDLNTSASATPGKIEGMRTATERFGDDWQKVKNQITDALKPLSEDVFKTLDEGLKGFSNNLQDLIDKGFPGFTGLDLLHQLPETPHPLGGTDTGAGHGGGNSGREWPTAGGAPNAPTGTPAAPTAPNIPTAAPYHPLDLNPADKPPGAESYDEWINSQKQVQSALDRQTDSSNRLAEAQQKQTDLLNSGKATQEQLNSAADELSKAQRENQQATQDVTVAQQKYVEDANKAEKTRRGRDDDPFDKYDPFKEATKNSQGLIPQLSGLLAASAANQALGNPYGKLQAEKRGEDPSNPLYTSEVGGRGSTGGGIPGAIGRLFQGSAIDQAQTPNATTGQAPGGGASPAGSVPALVPGMPQPGQPGGPGYTTDAALLANVPAGQYGRDKGDDLTKGLGDCSSAVEDLVNIIDGKSTASGPKMSTGSEAQWLTARGFVPGMGAPGDFRVGFNDHHTQATLPGGTNFNWGSDAAAAARGVGPNAGAGAFDPAFTSHFYRPEIPAGGGAPAPTGAPPAGSDPGPLVRRGESYITAFAAGGSVPSSDTVPAMLTPHEFVVNKDAAQKNMPELQAMNAGKDPHEDPHMPKADAPRMSPSSGGAPAPSSRQPLGSVTPPPPGPRVGQGTGSGFGIGGGIIGMAESAAVMAAMAAGGMAGGGLVPDTPSTLASAASAPAASAGAGAAAAGGAGGGSTGGGGGAPSGGSGDPMTAVLNRTVGYIGQMGAIGVQGLMSSLIPGASQKGGIMDGGILSKVVGGFAGAHPSAPNTAGNTATPLAPPGGGGGQGGGDTHIGQAGGVSIGTMHVASPDDGKKVANDLAFQSYAGYGGR
jgi:TP901 family phage tail tape measure protein